MKLTAPEYRDQLIHGLVCGMVGIAGGFAIGLWALPLGGLVQFYREEGQHQSNAWPLGSGGKLDTIVGICAGVVGTVIGVYYG
jgi:hypothetical protein